LGANPPLRSIGAFWSS